MVSRKARPRSARSRSASAALRDDLVLGIDLGATKVVSALLGRDGAIVRHSGRHLHSNDGPDGVIRALVRSAETCLEGDTSLRPRAAGVAVAAQVDPRTGTVIHAPNLGWRDVPLARRVSKELGDIPVVVLNDARAATLAEWRFGAGRGVSDLFCMFLGTGVGGSAVVGDRLLEGGTHALGEVGHITIVVGGRKCHCPNRGCLEAYVGGWAIAERAQEAVRSDPESGAALVARAGTERAITAQTVFQVYRAGDVLAGRLVRETERFLADGAVSVVNAFNPSVFVLGGGLVAGMPEFVPVVEAAIRVRCQPPAAMARVLVASFGENAPLVGAGEAARGQAFVGRA
ncbi:MAG: ROK family protein [Thermoplasmata archaeon]